MRHDDAWPSVGIVIPNQARLAELAEAIASVERQRYGGSTKVYLVHQPRANVTELIKRWPELVVAIPHENDEAKSSIAVRRNIGVQSSSEDLIAFLDDDDLWHPDKLGIQVQAMKAQNAVGCFTRWMNFRPDESPVWTTIEESKTARALNNYDLMRSGRSVTSSMLVDGRVARTLLLNERRDWTGLDDYDFKLRLGRRGKTILIQQQLTALRIDQTGGSRARPALHFATAFDVFVSWTQNEGWSLAIWRALLVRWGVTAIFPQGALDPIAVERLTTATSKLQPSWLGRFVRWSTLRAWHSRYVVPAFRLLLPRRVIE